MLYPKFEELIAYKNLKKFDREKSCQPSRALTLGGQHSPFRGQGLEFDSVRKYVPGDDIRNIDWKVTARSGSAHLKILKEERQKQIVLCLDINARMRFGTRNTFKSVQAARIASLLGWQAILHQDNISACLFGDVPGGFEYFTPKQNKTAFSRFLKRLCEPSLESHLVHLVDALQRLSSNIPTGAIVYIISDFMDLGEETELKRMFCRLTRKCEAQLVSVNDPSDQALIPIGKLNVFSNSQEKFVLNTDSLAGREKYALQWKNNRISLYEQARQSKIPLIELSTESEIKKDFLLSLRRHCGTTA